MASYPLPPWLAPVNPVPYAVQGFQQGESIAERQNRAELAIMEMTLRREQQQRLQEQANQEMALRNQQAAEQAKQAAMKWEGQQEYGALINSGMNPSEAFGRTAHKLIPGQLGQFITSQEAQKAISERAKAAEADRLSRLAEAGRFAREKFEATKEHWKAMETKPKSTQRTPEQMAKEKNLDMMIRAKNAQIIKAAGSGFGPEDTSTQETVKKLEAERDALMRQRESLYAPAAPQTMDSGEDEDWEDYPLPVPTPSAPAATSAPAVKRWKFNPDTGELEPM